MYYTYTFIVLKHIIILIYNSSTNHNGRQRNEKQPMGFVEEFLTKYTAAGFSHYMIGICIQKRAEVKFGEWCLANERECDR